MKSFGLMAVMVAGLMAGSMVHAQAAAPAAAPAGSTGLCKDGSYTSNATKKGSCAGHKGVKTWYGAPAAAAAAAPAAAAAAAPAAAAAKAAPAAAAAPATAAAAATKAPAAGGGPGQVWVNTGSKTKAYHCQGDKYYGTTKAGQYMSEADAKAAGYHAAKGSKCSG